MSSRAVLSRRLAAASIGALVGLVALPLLATAASAHVAVSSADAVRGGEAGLLVFRVPNESATAGTVKLTIDLPVDALLGFVDTQPLQGWTVTTTERKLGEPTRVGDFTLDKVTSSVTWTAAPGVRVGPDQFQLFQMLVGPLPDGPTMTFSAVQYYSDGTVVHWNEPYPASGVEPENPTPVLDLPTDSGTGSKASPDAAAKPTVTVGASPVAQEDDTRSTSDGTARLLGGAGLAVGALGLLVGGLGRRRSPSGSAEGPER
jgi:periplasmic copper chaperone A